LLLAESHGAKLASQALGLLGLRLAGLCQGVRCTPSFEHHVSQGKDISVISLLCFNWCLCTIFPPVVVLLETLLGSLFAQIQGKKNLSAFQILVKIG